MNLGGITVAMEKEALKIKLIKELEVTDLSGEKVMIDFSTGKYFMLKGSANEIWDILHDGITVDEIVDNLMEIYDVDIETCTEAVEAFINQMVEYKFAELV